MGHSDDYLRLAKGTYYFGDAYTNKIKAANLRTVTVTGRRIDAKVPAHRTIALSKHATLPRTATISRHSWLRLASYAGRPYAIGTFPVAKSATSAQLTDLLNAPSFEKFVDLAGDFSVPTLNKVLGAHRSVTSANRLWRGRYMVLAFPISGNISPSLHRGQVSLLPVR